MTTTADVRRHPSPAAPRAAFSGVVRAEWVKLRSLRSTIVSLVVALVVLIGLGALASFAFGQFLHHAPGGTSRAADSALGSVPLGGTPFAELVVGILGALVVTGEYSSGAMRTTLLACPRRTRLLAAKAVPFGLVGLVFSEVAAVIAFYIGRFVLASLGQTISFASPGEVRVVVGSGAVIALVGLLGLGLGSLLRRTPAAIGALVVLLFILPLLGAALPGRWHTDIVPYLPSSAIASFVSPTTPAAPDLGIWGGFAALIGYVLAALVGGAISFERANP